jgi:alginate O-acetyltransferase complex protein AlgI
MLFNSYEYLLIFLPTTLVLYFALQHAGHQTAAKIWLVAASLVFYSWWGLRYLPLITVSILVNYGIGTLLGRASLQPGHRKALLILGITFNLCLLGYFKYANFFVDNLNSLSGAHIQLERIVLPLAISFFTFQKIGYLVDSYRGETAGYSFLNYALFVTFFPQLIAGPIVHHKEIVPQFSDQAKWKINYANIAAGLAILGVGLFKKVILADQFAAIATPGFDTAVSLNLAEAWVTSLSYTFQLYFDFSGYTDMAIGAALMFNIRLPINFNSPYQALDIQDFWRRWHITLSRFLRDYVYIPLGGNRHGEINTYANLFLTFLIGGLWHGASWMFVIWGALHGAAVMIHRAWSGTGMKLPSVAAWFLTFMFVNVGWVFFRAKDLPAAIKVLSGMVDISGMPVPGGWPALQVGLLVTFALVLVLVMKPTVTVLAQRPQSAALISGSGVLFGIAMVTMFMATSRPSEFLYFNF